MASDASEVPSMSSEDQKDDGTRLAPTSPDTGVPADPNCGKDSLKATTEPAGHDEEGDSVCQFFLMGKCHFGHRCRLSHSDPSIDDSVAAPPDQDDKQDGKKTEKYKKKKGKVKIATKPEDNEGKDLSKKPRMRTADDVISRILWDSSVDASKFVVGYVDRFLGVLERPFSDFNWDTDPCDCDYSAELALPRHRIQYFTYRGHRVWDRHTRTDRVFGSTGQSLAPPFGGEEEVEEIHTEDQEQQEILEQDRLEATEEQPPAVSGQEESETEECTQTENTHLEEDKQNEMNIHTSDSAQTAPKYRRKASQEQQDSQETCSVEAAENRLEVSTDQMSSSQKDGGRAKEEGKEDASEEWEESWEGYEDCSSYHAALNISQNPVEPLEQRKKTRGGQFSDKRPTHFITFRANTPAILTCFQELRKELTTLIPSSAPHWQNASRLHVTMCLLKLKGPAEEDTAAKILRDFARLDRNPPVVLTFPMKLNHFNGKVLWLSPEPVLHLHQLNSGLREAYRKEGLLHKASYDAPRYHLTLAKVDRDREAIFEGVGGLKVGKGLNFGRLPINTLCLCAMASSKVDDFYETVCKVTLQR